MKLEDMVIDWYFSMRYWGVLMYVDYTCWGLDHTVLSRREPSYLTNISPASFTSDSDIGHSTISLFST